MTDTAATPVYRQPTINDVEDVELYAPGGYCPVNIGDMVGDSAPDDPKPYTVVHKLGHGPSSTVWLVKRDHEKYAISLEHVILKVPTFERMSEDQVLSRLGPVVSHAVQTVDGTPSKHAPNRLIQRMSFNGFDLFGETPDVFLIGLGKAFLVPDTPPTPMLQCATSICPPEVLLGSPASIESDIWQLGCLFFKLYTLQYPSEAGRGCYGELVRDLVKGLGPVPRHWSGQYRWDLHDTSSAPPGMKGLDLAVWFDSDQPTRPLRDRIWACKHLGDDEKEFVSEMLADMLAWEPSKRPSACALHRQLIARESNSLP